VGKIVKTCIAEGKLLKDLSLKEWEQFHPGFAADIYEAISPRQVVAARNSYGGTGFAQVKKALLIAREEISQ
jgi:argininosuccinate lyase